MRRAISIVVLWVLLGAWAPKPPHIDIKSIGIIAAVGDTCMFEHVPERLFDWLRPPKASFLEISEWGIDDEVTKTIAAALGPAYRTQSIPIEHQDFDSWTYGSLTLRIRELPAPETPIDAYLLVLRDWRADEIDRSAHQLGGLGLYRRDLARGRQHYGVFAAYRLVVMEADRGRIIASHAAILTTGEMPELPVKSALWPRTQNDLTDNQREALHAGFLALINNSLPVTLGQLGFAIK